MNIKNRLGGSIELSQDKIDNFKAQLLGQLIYPHDSGYEALRTVWNGMIDKKPSIIVRCLGTSDVIKSVAFAADNDLLVCIKGGGHNIGGLAVADGGMMLDMSLMRGIWVEPVKKIAHAQAGCLLGDIDRETQLYGLAAVLGFVSQTGAAGLTLGGGFGYLTRKYGWTADNVESMNVVTADGNLVRASSNENPELFWGLRGGGGNFGVVTNIDFNLYPVGPDIIGGIVAWPFSEAEKVIELYREISQSAPRELTLVCIIRSAPPAPWIPQEWHGKMIAGLLACYTGNPENGEKAVQPIKSFGKPIADMLMRRPYAQMQSLLDATQPKGRRYYWKSEYLSEVKSEMIPALIEKAEEIRSPHSALILFQLGGALNEMEKDHSPVGNRDAKYVLNITAAWDKPEEDTININWAKSSWEALRSFSTGGTYINFLTEDEGIERTNAALGAALTRLSEIKRKWDPNNLFCTNRNIKPARR